VRPPEKESVVDYIVKSGRVQMTAATVVNSILISHDSLSAGEGDVVCRNLQASIGLN
jgi:hypothetical protein